MSYYQNNAKQLRDEALDEYLNREEFQYDPDADAVYRQYKDRYTQLGRQAMQDTMGQAAALTGGYGSSYAQTVGQQAYNSYLQQLGDVIPELYQLAYDRYQDKGDKLYKTYQLWSQLEQQEAKKQEAQQQEATTPQNRATMRLGKGSIPKYDDPMVIIEYDNQNVTTGDVMVMQRVLGLEEDGLWTKEDQRMAGGMEADVAWGAYQKGQLQKFFGRTLGDQGLPNADVRTMERVLGLSENGVWSDEDKAAAGGLSEAEAWKKYQSGLLSMWRSKG